MHQGGFEEEKVAYVADDPRKLIGQVRRFGDAGPAYEIMGIAENGDVLVEVIYSDEKVRCKLAEVLEDPMAETIP